MLKSPTTLIFLLYFFIVPSTGQDLYKIDSLVTELNQQNQDSARCRIMFQIASEISVTDTMMALEYLESAKLIATDLDDTQSLGRYYQILGQMHSYHGIYRLAILEYDRALAYFSEADDNIKYFEAFKTCFV